MDTVSAADRKGPFPRRPALIKKRGLQCCFVAREGGFARRAPFQPQFRRTAVLVEAIFVSPKGKQSPESHGPFLSLWPRLFWQGEKIIVVHIQWRNASKSAGSVARIEGNEGLGMNMVTWGAERRRRPHTSPDAWECIRFSWAVWKKHPPPSSFPSFSSPYFFFFLISHLRSNVWSPLM